MSFLSFLNGVTLDEVTKPTRTGGGVKKQWNPASTFMGIRIWKNGSVFPSQALVDALNLEYPKVNINVETKEDGKTKRSYSYPNGVNNGLDIIDSRIWLQYKGDQHFLAIAIVAKDQPKVDLFASTKYNEDGTPLSSVMEQGSATFGKSDLLPALQEVYGVEPNEEGFIDLFIDTTMNLKSMSSNGIFLFPKKVARGDDKGKADYQRRENVDVYGLVPVQLLDTKEEPVEATSEEVEA